MEKCSFCKNETERNADGKLPDGWGKAQIAVPGKEAVDVTFCPDHRKEAEAKLDLAFQV